MGDSVCCCTYLLRFKLEIPMKFLMKTFSTFTLLLSLFAGTIISSSTFAADYVIDGTGGGMHSFVQFKASHMGISSLWGRFNDIKGTFSYDADDIEASHLEVIIDPASMDTNHEARDVHLTSADYIDVAKFPEAKFVSTSFTDKGNGTIGVTGDFTFHGVTKSISFDVVRTGEGETPFGDYRVGFEGTTEIEFGDFGITPMTIGLILSIEGIRS